MDAVLIRNGADLELEVTVINPITGNGVTNITSPLLAVEASIEKRSGTNRYWNGVDFLSVPEPALIGLTHIRDGIWGLTLAAASEESETGFRIHVSITGFAGPGVNTNAAYSTTVPALPSTATINEGNQTVLDGKLDTAIFNQAAMTVLLNNIITTGDAGPWTSGGGGEVTLEDNAANKALVEGFVWDAAKTGHVVPGSFGESVPSDIKQWGGSALIDSIPIAKFPEILLAYTTGRFRINFPTPGDITFYLQNNTTEAFTMHITKTERTRK